MIEVHDCEQGSEEWFRVRAGIPTASEFHTVLAKGKDGGASITRRKYLLRLAGERLTGECETTYSNAHMDRGKEMETDARRAYAFLHDADPQLVGFIRNGDKGCSPDSLIGTSGMLEIKTALPSILLDRLLKDDFPADHKAQCQGALWVAEREWIDIAIYWPRLPLVVRRAYRDEPYIAKLAEAVDAFNAELQATVDQVRRYAGDDTLKEALAASIASDAIRDISGRVLRPLEIG